MRRCCAITGRLFSAISILTVREQLKASRVLVVGLGRLGCAAAQYLAAAGVGQLTCSISTPSRSPTFSVRPCTATPPSASRGRLRPRRVWREINPHVQLTALNARLEDAALAAQIAAHDLVLDCTDNVAIRNQLNAGCFRHKTPLVSGAAIRMEGPNQRLYVSGKMNPATAA